MKIGWLGLVPPFISLSAFAVITGARLDPSSIVPASARDRQQLINAAHALFLIDRQGRSLLQGPPHEKYPFEFNDRVDCDFTEPDPADPPNGASAKLYCHIGKLKLKVKYQSAEMDHALPAERNDGIWAEVLSTRLLWALGFPANDFIPVHLVCHHCPPKPWRYVRFKLHLDDDPPGPEVDAVLNAPRVTLDIPDAVVEVKWPLRDIEMTPHQGWAWDDEFDHPVAEVKAEREALALLAAFIQHSDNKAEQQRLLCTRFENGRCLESLLELHDLGLSFGYGYVVPAGQELHGWDRKLSEDSSKRLAAASLRGFAAAPLWTDSVHCITHVGLYPTGVLGDKKISEAGRKLLVERLQTLTDQDLRDLFTVARIERRGEFIGQDQRARLVTVDDWVYAFRQKVRLLERHTCPE